MCSSKGRSIGIAENMSLTSSFKDILLGTPTRSSSSSRSSATEAMASTEAVASTKIALLPVACQAGSTPTQVAPTPMQQAPAEVPSDELPLTLQAYPHLRNTPAAKGWRRRPS